MEQQKITKQKNPLRVEQGKKLVEHNRRRKEELKRLNDHITKQYEPNIVKQKPNDYKYVGIGVGLLLIGGYIMYNQIKKKTPALPQKSQLIEEPKLVKPIKDIHIME